MKKVKKSHTINVGVIGYGGAFNMGKGHLDEMKNAGMVPYAITDLDPARREAARKDFPDLHVFDDLDSMLACKELHLVSIITPHNTHTDIALKALKAGKHVVSEKPFAITTAECDAMIAEAKKRNRMVSTYHNRHWDGCIVQAVKTVRSGAIGEVVRVEAHVGGWGKPSDWWRTSKSISGGILYDWGVHLLEYTLQIIDDEITEVAGFAHNGFWAPHTAWKKDTNEDEGFAVVRFRKGAWATLNVSSIDSKTKEGMLEITGTKGSYVFDGEHWTMYTHGKGTTIITKGQNPKTEWWRYYENVAAHLTKEADLVITPQWARRCIHIIDLACQSAQKGKSLTVKYP